jgi:hypothetical protein
VRRRRAGRPQRSEDRTGPASERGGRRPHLTRERKFFTAGTGTVTVRSRLVHGLRDISSSTGRDNVQMVYHTAVGVACGEGTAQLTQLDDEQIRARGRADRRDQGLDPIATEIPQEKVIVW